MNDIQRNFLPKAGTAVELHASEIRSGSRIFRGMPKTDRATLMHEVYKAIAAARGLTLLAAVIDKAAFTAKYHGQVEPYRGAFEGLCTMFNFFLRRKQQQTKRVGRGIIVFDGARPSLSREIRKLLAEFLAGGTKWVSLSCVIETAFFFDSRSSRLMQIADFAAYSVYRWYEAGDDSYLKIVFGKFDRQGTKLHGLKCHPLESTKPYPAGAQVTG